MTAISIDARRVVSRIGVLRALPGIVLAGVLALLALELAKVSWLQANGISALTLAIALGIIVGNTLYPRMAAAAAHGVAFSKQTLLRAGIILYGLRLTFQDIANVGVAGVIIDALVLSSTFALAWWAGTRIFGLDRETALLIGAGSSICGAAAVMAAEPVVRGRAEQVTVAVSTVVVFGTLAIFLYPALYHLNARYQLLPMSPARYGIFAGSTIHEVAQVMAAGRAVTDAAAKTAVITKMVRVMMLAPFLIILSAYLARRPEDPKGQSKGGASSGRRIVIPWFALGFVAVAALNSLMTLPRPLAAGAISLDTFMLAMAMAALGVTTHVSALRIAGIKPLGLAALLFAWLFLGGLAINTGISAAADSSSKVASGRIEDLLPAAKIHVGRTADWVAIVPDAVWVGSTGPSAVHRIDPATNREVATVSLPGKPCAGLAVGFGSLWVPLCGESPAVARVDLASNRVVSLIKVAGVLAEGGITTSPDSVWLVVDKAGALARITPTTQVVQEVVRVPPGSFNPLYHDGRIWVSQADGAQVTILDALTGSVLAAVPTGPHPRFLTAGDGAVWTLNQGDGSLTRIDAQTEVTKTIDLDTPGHGGDIKFGAGMIWSTMAKVPLSGVDSASVSLRCRWTGPGGDSLDIGDGAVWLTDYDAGNISRIKLEDALALCKR